MTDVVIDKWGPATPEQITSWNAIGQVGYLSFSGHTGKEMTPTAFTMLVKAGKFVSFVFEQSFNDWIHGYELGHKYGIEARRQLREDFGLPDSTAIGIAVDDDIHPNQLPTALAHVQGFRDGCGVAWVYGTAFLIDACRSHSYVDFGMQSCSSGFYDNARTSPHAALKQRCGHDFDLDVVLQPNWGQTPSHTVVPHPPTPAPPHQEAKVLALLNANNPTHDDHEQPYLDIAHDGKSIIAVFSEQVFGPDTPDHKVTNGFGLSALHLEPGEVAVKLAERSSQSVLVVLADGSTRTVRVADPFTIIG